MKFNLAGVQTVMPGHLFFLLMWWMWVGDLDRNSDPPKDALITTSDLSGETLFKSSEKPVTQQLGTHGIKTSNDGGLVMCFT